MYAGVQVDRNFMLLFVATSATVPSTTTPPTGKFPFTTFKPSYEVKITVSS